MKAASFTRSLRMILPAAAWLAIVVLRAASAATLPAPPIPFALPPYDANAFNVSVAFRPTDGLMYVWTGAEVLRENAPLSPDFTSIGAVGSGSADAGPIVFSRDGTQLLIGNGAGGALQDTHNGQIFKIPVAGGDSHVPLFTAPYHSNFLAAPLGASNTRMFVNQSTPSFAPSTVTVLDFANEASVTNSAVIQNIPGSSASMAIHDGKLYVGVGFGPAAGSIYSFPLSALENALNTATPLEWTAGTPFNSLANNSAFGMFFDARGYLFAGGGDGVTVFDTSGTALVYENNGFTGVEYDPVNDRVLVTGYGTHVGFYPASMFTVPEPAAIVLAIFGVFVVLAVGRRRVFRHGCVA